MSYSCYNAKKISLYLIIFQLLSFFFQWVIFVSEGPRSKVSVAFIDSKRLCRLYPSYASITTLSKSPLLDDAWNNEVSDTLYVVNVTRTWIWMLSIQVSESIDAWISWIPDNWARLYTYLFIDTMNHIVFWKVENIVAK